MKLVRRVGTKRMFFAAGCCFMDNAVCASALSWEINQLWFCHNWL